VKRPDLVAGAFFLALAIWTAFESTQLQYYTSIGPGPGFFPFWIALALGAFSVSLIWQGMRAEAGPLPAGFWPDRKGRLQFGAIVLALTASTAVIELAGFRLTMLVFYLFLLPALGWRRPLVTVAIAVGGSFGLFYLFDALLHVPLPTGPFGL
jgi:putative tricarboxylic transport membrane protein